MTRVVGALLVGILMTAVLFAGWLAGSDKGTTLANPDFSAGADVDASGNTAVSLGNIETSRTVACGDAFAIDIYVKDVADLLGGNVTFKYNPAILGVYARDVQMLLAASPGSDVRDLSYGDPGFTGNYDLLASDISDPPAPEGAPGVLARLSVKALAPGVTNADVAPERFWATSGLISNPPAATAQITVTGQCGTPVPTPTPEPSPTPTPTGTPTPESTHTSTPESTDTPTSEPTNTPTAGPTGTPTPPPPLGTVNLVNGWNDSCYQGPEQQIGDAFAGVAGVQAIYRMKNQTFDRWFPDRPELSTITTLSPFDVLLILANGDATWTVTPADNLPGSAPLSFGWNSICYLGDAQHPDAATAAIAGKFAVLYTLLSDQAWRRYVPGRPEVSNLPILYPRTSVLVLVTDSNDVQWVFNP